MPASHIIDRVRRDRFRDRLAAVFSGLLIANALTWAWALYAFLEQPVLLGMAALAYSLGLRHALDADHIAAIDNVTRKLMQEGKRPVAVGLFFALGHSTVVVAASILIAMIASSYAEDIAKYREITGTVGTFASAMFLFIIALANLAVLGGVYQAYRQSKSGKIFRDEDIDALLRKRGWLTRYLTPLFGLISKSWHLFPIGLLFALGFETASEISLFGLSASASGKLSSMSVMIFPALFTAGMTLVDTADGILMLGAYGWAYRSPSRKLLYNLIITLVSILVAVVIGGIETLGLISDRLDLQTPFWSSVSMLNSNFGLLGYGVVSLFILCWSISWVVYRTR
ncbi:MAG: HoxN/HupN/NixA family nickel/cobalt transporter [Xanthobacteraceae bacterium]|nr:HoxN/HupN/NixA family nickel/cobalt transporter [Xanthobacteraceae bacterium]